MIKVLKAAGTLSSACFAVSPSFAYAQEIPSQNQENATEDAQASSVPNDPTKTIVVTARRREEADIDVPLAITILDSTQIAAAAPRTLRDFDGMAPNLIVNQNPSNVGVAAVFMRGLGYSDSERTQSPAVGITIDGVALGTSAGALMDAFDVESVEIDRGPQGILFGKNTTGGVVNIRRSRPSADMGVKAAAAIGRFEERSANVIFNTGMFLNGTTSLKLGYSHRQNEGYSQNLYTGELEGGENIDMIHAMALFEPTPNFDALLVFDRVWAETTGQGIQLENPLTQSVFGIPGDTYNGLGPNEVIADFQNRGELDFTRLSLEMNLDLDWVELTSITGWVDAPDTNDTDFDAGCPTALQGGTCSFLPNPILGTLHLTRTLPLEQFSQELRGVADINEIFGSSIDGVLTAGAYYYWHDVGNITINRLDLSAQGLSPNEAVSRSVAQEKTESISVFAAVDLDITDRFSVSAGLRYIDESKRFSSQVFNRDLTQPEVVFDEPVFDPQIRDQRNSSDLLTAFSASYSVTPDNQIYVRRAEGVRSGGFSIRGTLSETFMGQPNFVSNDNFLDFDSEDVTSYEIGSKNVFANGDVRFNIAAFTTKLKGQQVPSTIVTLDDNGGPFLLGTNTYILNYQEVRIRGIELDASVRVSAIPGLSITGALGILDADVKEADIDNRLLPVGPFSTAGSTGTTDFSGTPVRYAPDYNYSITVNHTADLTDNYSLETNLLWRYQDDVVLDVLGTVGDVESGYVTFNASMTLRSFDGWWITASGQNLFDEDYRTFSFPSVFFQTWGAPRRWRLEVGMEF